MQEVIFDTLIDTLKLMPFLFFAFLLMEYIEHKLSSKSVSAIKKTGKFGPLFGSVLGIFPQCGFSVAATNLFSARIITIGTLISIYLSTSDEMIPILISHNTSNLVILRIIGFKIIIGVLFGFIIDFILRKKEDKKDGFSHFCHETHCECEDSILKSSIKHTINIALFIIVISFLLNITVHYLGEDVISDLFTKNNILGPIISSLIGLIPNCASSVIITELYLNNAISVGSMIAGVLTGSGVALIVLFKVNKNKKENSLILLLLYLIGVVSGIIINLLGINF